MKIQLSITRDYCPDWGIREGVREVVQNYLDARDQGNEDSGKIHHEKNLLTFTNYDVTISPADVGLLGRSGKGPKDRGQFGEGLKIGVLALVRAGCTVSIRSADRWYEAALERSEEFGEEVLVFNSGGTHAVDKVEIRILGITASTWTDLRRDFLDLREKPYTAHVTPHGEILLDEEEKGRAYSRGIFVGKYEDLSHGYNFTSSSMKLDRDRKMVDDFDLTWALSQMHASMLQAEETTPEEFLENLESGSRSTRHAASFLGVSRKKAIAKAFEEKHGPDAVPGDAPRGLKGITVTTQLEEVLQDHKTEKIQAAKGRIQYRYTSELTVQEQAVSDAVMFLLEKVDISHTVEYVEFESPDTKEIVNDGKICVSRSELRGPISLLRTILEAAEEDRVEVYERIIAKLKSWKYE